MEKKVALVTGASSGFGKTVSLGLLDKGYTLYAAARRLEPMKELEEKGAKLISMDVTDDDSVQKGVKQILEDEGRIDLVFNNAGYGAYGPVDIVPIDDVIRQFDVNLFGVARVNAAVLPTMRAQRSGRIVITASLASHVSTPGSGWYGASKHAVKGMVESLRMETAALGIDVVQIEPGFVQTGFEEVAFKSMDKVGCPDEYRKWMSGYRNYLRKAYASSPGPEGTAAIMLKAATVKKPKAVYRTTGDSKVLPIVRNILGIRLFSWIMLRLFASYE